MSLSEPREKDFIVKYKHSFFNLLKRLCCRLLFPSDGFAFLYEPIGMQNPLEASNASQNDINCK